MATKAYNLSNHFLSKQMSIIETHNASFNFLINALSDKNEKFFLCLYHTLKHPFGFTKPDANKALIQIPIPSVI